MFVHILQPHSPSTLPRNRLETSRENTHGMSPKKVHEVNRMTTYVSQLISTLDEQNLIRHVIDIGAGQVSFIFAPFTGRLEYPGIALASFHILTMMLLSRDTGNVFPD